MSRYLPLFLLLIGACDGTKTGMGRLELESVEVTFVSGYLGQDCGASGASLTAGDAAPCPEGEVCPVLGCGDGMVMLDLANPNAEEITGVSIEGVSFVSDTQSVPEEDRVIAVTVDGSTEAFDGQLAAEETVRVLITFRGPTSVELTVGEVARAIIRIAIGDEDALLETPDLIFVPNVAT